MESLLSFTPFPLIDKMDDKSLIPYHSMGGDTFKETFYSERGKKYLYNGGEFQVQKQARYMFFFIMG